MFSAGDLKETLACESVIAADVNRCCHSMQCAFTFPNDFCCRMARLFLAIINGRTTNSYAWRTSLGQSFMQPQRAPDVDEVKLRAKK